MRKKIKIGDVVRIQFYIPIGTEPKVSEIGIENYIKQLGVVELVRYDIAPYLVRVLNTPIKYWFHREEIELAEDTAQVLYGK